TSSEGGHTGSTTQAGTTSAVFQVAFPFVTGTTDVSLVHAGTVLWTEHLDASAPTVSSTLAAAPPANLTNTPNATETAPAITADGRWLAWNDGTQIVVQSESDPTVHAAVPSTAGATQAAWGPTFSITTQTTDPNPQHRT